MVMKSGVRLALSRDSMLALNLINSLTMSWRSKLQAMCKQLDQFVSTLESGFLPDSNSFSTFSISLAFTELVNSSSSQSLQSEKFDALSSIAIGL